MTKPAAQPTPAPFSVIPLAGDIDDLPAPNGAPYFVMTRQGPMVHKNLLFGRVLVPVKNVPTLAELPDNSKGYLWADAPTFPWELLNQAWAFFRWAWDDRKSEAAVDIVWNPAGRERRMARQGFDDNGFRLFVPPQTASAGGVKILRNEQHYGDAQLVGTIHSHCNGGAYHSGTDTHDAEGHDGLHMTIGRVSANKPEIDVMVAANKVLWNRLDLADYTGGVKDGWNRDIGYPEWWNRFHEDPAAKEHFRGQQFAAGARPTSPAPVSTPRWNGPQAGGASYHKISSPYANFKLDQMDDFIALIKENNTLPDFVDERAWEWDLHVATELLQEVLDEMKGLGLNTTLSLWYSRNNFDARKDTGPRILGLWDEDELDADTRLALAAMEDDDEIEVRTTETGIMVITRDYEPKGKPKGKSKKTPKRKH